jgi:hypothetical protein
MQKTTRILFLLAALFGALALALVLPPSRTATGGGSPSAWAPANVAPAQTVRVQAATATSFVVSATHPMSNGLIVARDTVISATLNRPVEENTVSTRTFTVRGSQTGVYPGIYFVESSSGTLLPPDVINFDPARDFKPGEEVVVNLSGGISSTGGISLTPYAWQFRAAVLGGSGVFTDSGQSLGSSPTWAVALGDLDSDGDLDAFVGNFNGQANKIWLNNGTGGFGDSGQSLGSSESYAAALGDLDGDGDLDAFVANQGPGNKVWLNDGTGIFSDSGQSLGSSNSDAVALGDVDGDGDLDAFIANAEYQADKVWLNNGTGAFYDSGQDLNAFFSRAMALGDLDSDGDLDAFVVSHQAGTVLLNDGAGAFTDSGQDLSLSNGVSLAVGDVDGDGDLDAFVGSGGNQANTIWLNDGMGTFNNSGQNMGDSASEAVALGDVDSDGDLDAFVGNSVDGSDPANRVWLNDGAGNFSDSGQNIGNSGSLAVALGDLDGDGDLDVFVGNNDQANKVWLNQDDLHVTQVFPPNAAFDVARDTTVSADFNLPVQFATVSTRTFTVRGSQTGVYAGTYTTGSVQFDPVQNFKPGEEVVANLSSGIEATNGISLTPYVWQFRAAVLGGSGVFTDSGQRLGSSSSNDVALGDLDADGDLDAFIGQEGGTLDEVWLNDGTGIFTDSGQSLSGGMVDLGDVDGDGDLDAIVASSPSRVWLNGGGIQGGTPGYYIDSGQNLTISIPGPVELGDLDGDGDLDAFIGALGSDKVWLNEGGIQGGTLGYFVDSGQSLGSATSGDVALGDLDQDGDLDAVVTNETGPNHVWLNDGTGYFSSSGQTLGNVDSQDVALGDVDGDGDLDVFVANEGGGSGEADKIWLNDGAGYFSDSGQSLGNSDSIGVSLGDLDGDGDLDAFVQDSVWLNDGSGSFDSGQDIHSGAGTETALGDLDGDGDLDAFIVSNVDQPNTVWLNENAFQVTQVSPPNAALDVAQDMTVSVEFNLPVDFGTVSTRTFTVRGSQTGVYAGAYTTGSVRFDPIWDFAPGEEVVVNLSSGISSTTGISLTPYAWSFRAAVAGGSGVFTAGQSLDYSNSHAAAVGDLDGDTDLDVFIANAPSQANHVWLNNGAASFTNSGQSLGDSWSYGVALGDLDGDGDLDAFVANYGQADKIWLNDGAGYFSSHQSLYTLGDSRVVSLGDLDGDGDLDALVGNVGGGKVWWNDGAGTFSDSGQTLGTSDSWAVAIGDLDNDGDLDSFVDNGSLQFKVWLNDGKGLFVDSGHDVVTRGSEVALGDVDGDGDLDAVIGACCYEPNQVWLNDGDGVFSDSGQVLDLGGSGGTPIALGDVDGDGDLDALLGTWGGEKDQIWLNDGLGVFTESDDGLGNAWSYDVALGDLDQDGDLDGFVVDSGAQVWLNGGMGAGPAITVNPRALGATVNPGATATHTLAIGNVGGSGLTWVLTEQPGVAWLSETPGSGSALPSQSADVAIVFDAEGLPEDVYTTTLRIDSDATNEPVVEVSVTLTVTTVCIPVSGADFAFVPLAPQAGEVVTFTSAVAAGTMPITYTWDLGDGGIGGGQVVTHAYGVTGVYTVTLTAANGCPSQDTASKSVTVGEAPAAPVLNPIENEDGDGDYTVSWSGSGGATGYTLEEAEEDSFAGATTAYVGPFTSTLVGGQSEGTHYYRVKATNAYGSSGWSNTESVLVSAPPPPAPGDGYEPDDTCDDASVIVTDGVLQRHTFHAEADQDWVSFQATAGMTYTIEARTPATSTADIVLEVYSSCSGGYQQGQGYTFSPDIYLQFTAPADGTYYLRLFNQTSSTYGADVAYNLSVRSALINPLPGALILVAGKYRDEDPLQDNIHHVTDDVYNLFRAHGYPPERIRYLATDLSLDPDGGGADVFARPNQTTLGEAITTWAAGLVSADRALTLYLMDHGYRDKFYLDRPFGEWITPGDLDGWLNELETAVPGVKVNVIIEACFSGSFIDPAVEMSEDGRVIITSSGAQAVAYASQDGAVFSDAFLSGLDQGMSLQGAFDEAKGAAHLAHPDQTSWLDDDGDASPNTAQDGQEAARRGFAFAGTLAEVGWAPYVVEAEIRNLDLAHGEGEIWAQVVDDEQRVHHAWAVVYPPSYRPVESSEELVDEPVAYQLLDRGSDWRAITYNKFDEVGEYRIVVYAEDDGGLLARPKLVTVRTGWSVYLPLVFRNENPW